jgi:hypothetical protein|uniref:AAA+ ATPase domain-containing protein n=1 Tax=viral metagenome TaxID=1070528 RepID=A0A6C0J2B1_9ZZZZ
MSWNEKYTPVTLDKIVGNKNAINEITHVINNKEKTPIMCYGKTGLGKSTIVSIIFKQHKYSIKLIDLNKNKKNVFEVLTNSLFSKNIESYFTKEKKTVYLIDNMETIKHEKDLNQIVEFIFQKKLNEDDIMVCITNNFDQLDQCKNFKHIEFKNIDNNDIARLVNRIKNKENIKINKKDTELIIENCENNFNKTINTVYQLYLLYGTNISSSNINEFFKKKNRSSNIKHNRQDTLLEIFDKNITANNCIIKFNKDKSMLPMLVNDNFLSFFYNSSDPLLKKLFIMKQCTNYIMLGDICDKLIYNQNNWSNQYIHCLLSCYFPANYVNKMNYTVPDDLSVSKTLGKYSRYRTNIKNIITIFEQINGPKFYSIDDVHHISNTILYSIYSKETNNKLLNIDYGVNMLIKHNMDYTFIDKLQKIDILNKNKYRIKNKNKIKKIYIDQKTYKDTLI